MAHKARVFATVLILAVVAVGIGMVAVFRIREARESGRGEIAERPPLSVGAFRSHQGPIRAWVFGEGTARAVRREFLNFEIPGKVVFVGTEESGGELRPGSPVRGPAGGEKLGQAIARIDPRERTAAVTVGQAEVSQTEQSVRAGEAAVAQARSDYELARANMDRANRLKKGGIVTALDFDSTKAELEKAEAALTSAQAQLAAARSQVEGAVARLDQSKIDMERTGIFAPFDGVLAYFSVRVGDHVSPEFVDLSTEENLLKTSAAVVIDPSEYEIGLEMPVYDGELVRRGQPAFVFPEGVMPSGESLIEAPKEDGAFARGEVYAVNPAVSPGGRSIEVRIRTTWGADRLRDGMFVTCWIAVEEKQDAVLAPVDTLLYQDNQPRLFVASAEEGSASLRNVRLGIEGLQYVEVLEGVKPGELLVTDGRHRLVDGSPVHVVEVREAQP